MPLNCSAVRRIGLPVIAGLLVALSAEAAAAAPTRVLSNTNLRQGPGTNFGVLATVPGGNVVEITNCAAQWCTAQWRGLTGYMVATNLDLGPAPAPVAGPPAVVVEPAPYFGPPYYYYGPRRYWGPRYRSWRRW